LNIYFCFVLFSNKIHYENKFILDFSILYYKYLLSIIKSYFKIELFKKINKIKKKKKKKKHILLYTKIYKYDIIIKKIIK